ncbi:MAG: hypothetical protein AAF597_07055, partial [Bacteroidota bacterium]
MASYFRSIFKAGGNLADAFQQLVLKVSEDEDFRKQLQTHLQHVVDNHSFLSFLTQYSHLDHVGFLDGIWSRLKHKLVPQLPPESDIQHFFREVFQSRRDLDWLRQIPPDLLGELFVSGGLELNAAALHRELSLSIQSLGAKVCAFGLDYRMRELFLRLELDVRPFAALQSALSGDLSAADIQRALTVGKAIRANINSLRLRKAEIGTTLELTYRTKRTLDKLQLLEDLLELRANTKDGNAWLRVISNSLNNEFTRMNLGDFMNGHVDLLALEIVEHTAKSGEKYIADNRTEYAGMFRASMLGGLLIAFFAAGKILLYDLKLSELPEGIVFSLNYASCFVLVKVFGGII